MGSIAVEAITPNLLSSESSEVLRKGTHSMIRTFIQDVLDPRQEQMTRHKGRNKSWCWMSKNTAMFHDQEEARDAHSE